MTRAIFLVLALCAAACSSTDRKPAACTPATPVPQSFTPPRPAMDACTSDELDGYFEACRKPGALPIACQQFVANHARCAACLSPTSNGGRGPLIASAGQVELNTPGCIALLSDDARPQSCAGREYVAQTCLRSACRDCTDKLACERQASDGVCQHAVLDRCSELAPAASCLLHTSDAVDFQRIARVFCSAERHAQK